MKDIDSFLKELASKKQTPSGGGAVALISSIATALCSMTLNLTVDKKFFFEYSKEVQNKLREEVRFLDNLRSELIGYMDKDAEVFDDFMVAMRLPKTTEKEKSYRKERMQKAYKNAMMIPFDLCIKSLRLYDALELSAEYGNPNLLSDTAISILSIYGAIESSIINVKINLKGIKDAEFLVKYKNLCKEIRVKNLKTKDKLLEAVSKRLEL